MARFALVCNFEGDYGFKVVFVDDRDTFDEAAAKAAGQLAGVVVPAVAPGAVLHVRPQGTSAPFPRNQTILEAGIAEMEPVEITVGAD